MTDTRYSQLDNNYQSQGYNTPEENEELIDSGMEDFVEDKPVLPEAPLSIHIDTYYRGFHIGFTKRSSEDSVSNQVGGVTQLIQSLIQKGFEPSWNKETNNNHIKKEEPESKSPTCGIHGTPMVWKSGTSRTTNKPYAFWSCPTKNADGSYCNYKPKQ